MRPLIKLTTLLLFTVVISVQIVAQPESGVAGSYNFHFEWGGGELILKNTGTFTATTGDCTQVTTQSGLYSVSNNVIRLTTLKMTIRWNGEKKEHDLTKRKNRKKYLDIDEAFKPETWELEIVRWGERVYLMQRGSFDSFVGAMNLGFEPRSVDGYRPYYGDIYLRDGDEKKPVAGLPAIPNEFLRNLLSEPIVATVLEIKVVDNLKFATIDRGIADGLRENTPLVPIIPSVYFDPCPIRALTEHSATVRVPEHVKVGDKLSTRVADVTRYAE